MFPGVPEPGRDPGGVIPGLPAAPGDAGPSISPPALSSLAGKTASLEVPAPKLLQRSSFFLAEQLHFPIFERQPLANMVQKPKEHQWFLYDFEHSD